ncbi:hypothetical protein [Streptomyces sp. NPDC050738]|uniref:hypothetical protein n=1 Tax=Streptomyces sp. NPDC050738 TaxID=3154744 RepID=UPI00342DA5A4
MSYPTPPGNSGHANPYGQQPQYGAWQSQGPVPGGNQPPIPGRPPGMPPTPPPIHTPPTRGSGVRRGFGVAIALVGVLVLACGGALADHAYSNSRQDIPNSSYGLSLWKNESADDLFPDTLGGRDAGFKADPGRVQWHRLGVSQDTSCDKGLSALTLKKAKELGCEAAPRATYVDPTGNTVVTVALMVIPGAESKRSDMNDFFEGREGLEAAVHALPVSGTLAAGWSDARRSGSDLLPVAGDNMPYVVAAVAGAADGRVAGNLPGTWGAGDLNGRMDRTAWRGAARDLASRFLTHIDDLQLGGSK